MKTESYGLFLAVGIISLFIGMSDAQAATTSQNFTLSSALETPNANYTMPVGTTVNTGTAAQDALSVSQFDPLLGTLTGVEVSYLLTYSSSSNVLGDGRSTILLPSLKSGSLSGKLVATLSDSVSNVFVNIDSNVGTHSFESDGIMIEPTSASTDGSLLNDATFDSASILNEFIGTGTLSLNWSSELTTYLDSVAIVKTTMNTTVSGVVTITYLYNAVPEPASWALLASSATLLLGCRRARKKSR